MILWYYVFGSRWACERLRLFATDTSIHTFRISPTTVGDSVVHAETSKNEEYLVQKARWLLITNTIQPREYSMGGGTGGSLYKTDSGSNRNIFKVERNDDGKTWLNNNNGNPDNHWNGNNQFVFVRSRNSPSFLSYPGEFCFCSCPFQPPNILPISSKGSESAIYFALSIDFASHRIINSIFEVSILRIATFT